MLIAKADPSQKMMDGIAMINTSAAHTHIDLMVVSPWNLGAEGERGGRRFKNVGKAMISYLLLNGSSALTLDAASVESEMAFKGMGFLPQPGSLVRRLVLEGESVTKFLQ